MKAIAIITEKRKREIRQEAESVVRAFSIKMPPIGVEQIARQERIKIRPSDYDGAFDARLEYIRSKNIFVLYYDTTVRGQTRGRQRFSIGHELGHYYLEEHRKRLVSGEFHNSDADFVSDDEFEREADTFSAYLLMPGPLFKQRMPVGCDLSDIIKLAQKFDVSLTSAAVRFVECTSEACCVIRYDIEKNRFASWFSEELFCARVGKLLRESGIPHNCPTKRLLGRGSVPSGHIEKGTVDGGIWFANGGGHKFWEEAILLGRYKSSLTLLFPT